MMNFSMLLVNNNRSKSYLQNLIKNGFIPDRIILLDNSNTLLPEHTENDLLISKDTSQKFIRRLDDLDIEFDEKRHILSTISQFNIDFRLLDTLDVNSQEVVGEIAKLNSDYVIYSGPGGTILRKNILSLGKKFIHVHPGWLPLYRGSTTIYYSMLLDSEVGCSVILFEEGIDEGPILYRMKYKIHERGIDFDYVLDPLVRTKALIEFFTSGDVNPTVQDDNEEANTFFIVHPFIKHCSIIKHNR